MVRVRAVVMARDDSSGGWLPVGGGGLSQVSVCRVRGARPEGGARQGHYVIHGERLRDQKNSLLGSILSRDALYQQALVCPKYLEAFVGSA
ncbi:sprouty-related, EVH1 domain-containing protein 2 [Cricetulus griseus]|uniref:Sprouty-related, EVH1 domain-containing protein 2 n=1 Tax=Cricetulus griseus TaxID=10029 RepID=A0A061HYU4_CRIGR|nr:sprouty-related, EVH1 domain-containing protein 2 [Cricetulus griseus]